MVTLQEQFEKDYPNKEVKEINIYKKYEITNFTNYDLDLREYKKLINLNCSYNNLTSIDVSKNVNLTELKCSENNLTSLDVSKNVNLTELKCSENNLTSVD